MSEILVLEDSENLDFNQDCQARSSPPLTSENIDACVNPEDFGP